MTVKRHRSTHGWQKVSVVSQRHESIEDLKSKKKTEMQVKEKKVSNKKKRE